MNNLFQDDVGRDGGEAIRNASLDGGSLLRNAREAAGLHIGALAVALKVPVKKLEALEADRFDLLPDVVFVRALASSVCRNLKIDAGPVLKRLPQLNIPTFAFSDRGINTPFRAPGEGLQPSLVAYISRPAALGGLALLFGALVLILMPAALENFDGFKSAVFDSNDRQSTSDTFPPASGAIAQTPAMPPDTGDGSVVVPSLYGNPSLEGGAKIEAQASAASSSTPDAIAQGALGSRIASKDVLSFSAKGSSWVEVTDAKGVVVLRRTLAIGEVVGVSGSLPLAAVVGRADAIVVEVRGTPFGLESVSKNNVARFEVK